MEYSKRDPNSKFSVEIIHEVLPSSYFFFPRDIDYKTKVEK